MHVHGRERESVRVAKSVNQHIEKKEMSQYHADNNDQSEISLINDGFAANGD